MTKSYFLKNVLCCIVFLSVFACQTERRPKPISVHTRFGAFETCAPFFAVCAIDIGGVKDSKALILGNKLRLTFDRSELDMEDSKSDSLNQTGDIQISAELAKALGLEVRVYNLLAGNYSVKPVESSNRETNANTQDSVYVEFNIR